MAKRKNKKVADVEEQEVEQVEEIEEPTAPAPRVRPMQLAPIIQPIAFVPYSTQEQDIFSYDHSAQATDNYGYYGQAVAREEAVHQEVAEEYLPSENAKKKVNFISILLIILSLLAIAVIVVGKFVKQDFLYMMNNQSGLDVILDFFKEFDLNKIGLVDAVPIAIIAMAACGLLILIGALIRIVKPGACVLTKIGAFLGLTVALVALILSLIEKDSVDVNIGLYIVSGIMLLCVLFSFGAKNYKKQK